MARKVAGFRAPKAPVAGSLAGRAADRYTGLYWECSTGKVIHPDKPTALSIKRGKGGAYFTRCGECENTHFLGPRWEPHYGLSKQQAHASFLYVI